VEKTLLLESTARSERAKEKMYAQHTTTKNNCACACRERTTGREQKQNLEREEGYDKKAVRVWEGKCV